MDSDGTIVERKLIVLYVNMDREDMWKMGNYPNDQIIALTTHVKEPKDQIKEKSNSTVEVIPVSSMPGQKSGSKQPYTMKPWHLEFKGKSVSVHGMIWYWCTKDHCLAGIK